jgi:hypothetical protein
MKFYVTLTPSTDFNIERQHAQRKQPLPKPAIPPTSKSFLQRQLYTGKAHLERNLFPDTGPQFARKSGNGAEL